MFQIPAYILKAQETIRCFHDVTTFRDDCKYLKIRIIKSFRKTDTFNMFDFL